MTDKEKDDGIKDNDDGTSEPISLEAALAEATVAAAATTDADTSIWKKKTASTPTMPERPVTFDLKDEEATAAPARKKRGRPPENAAWKDAAANVDEDDDDGSNNRKSISTYTRKKKMKQRDCVVFKKKATKGTKQVRYTAQQNKKWDEMFQRLITYKETYNSTSVPCNFEGDLELGHWVNKQRTRYSKNEISADRIVQLEQIDFVWNSSDVKWDEMFQCLVDYKNEFKSVNVPQSYKADPKLGNWVDNQRKRYIKKELSTDRIDRLESIDFVWNARDAKWMQMYNRLVAYNKECKSVNVPKRYKEDQKLAHWVNRQRTRYSNKELSDNRINRLKSIGFIWNPLDVQWDEMFQRLVTYKETYNSTSVPFNFEGDQELGHWVNKQRTRYSKNEISADRIVQLEQIDFVWNSSDVKWDEMFQCLVDYKNEFKSVNVPQSYKADPKLAKWVDNQRTQYRKKELSTDLIDRLESIGFVWKLHDVKWDEMFQRLVDYKNECNSVNVPRSYKADPKLGQWVDKQRTRYRKKELSEDRFDQLESIGFVWNLYVEWDDMFQRLVDYKNEFNSANVPSIYKADPKFAKWVQTQRTRYSKKELSADRIDRLEQIGFLWNLCDVKWNEMFQCLVDYKNEFNSVYVPQSYQADPILANWVQTQRASYKNEAISADRIDRLESIGFVWYKREAQWMEMYNRFVAYDKEHKSTNVPSKYEADPQLGNWILKQRNNYNNGKLSAKRSELLEAINFSL